ncbi:MAG TPA: glycosyltransferase family 39 protein [Acidobacteriaceae bacterium]|nr:glycosyltransferase family 39 protein [Acidobacteriaceae bacterium]
MSQSRPQQSRQSLALLLASSVIILTAVLSLLWSNARLLWQDEFLSFYSDSVPSVAHVVRVQLHSPISLDPPTYHLLSHFFMKLIGANAIALRLPALLGFLLMEISIYALVRRLASARAAIVAMTLPLVTASFRYSVEGRPYGLLLGLYAMALLCWYVAQDSEAPSHSRTGRTWALVGLALSIALAITSHYFGILILVPVASGEIARTIERRRLDRPMLLAIAAGFAAVFVILPFRHALQPYRTHYYINGVGIRDISQGYRELFVMYSQWPITAQRLTALTLVVCVLVLFWSGRRRFLRRPASESKSLWIALFAFAALPFFSFLFGRFITHTMEVRYVAATIIPFAVVAALVLDRFLRSTPFFAALEFAILLLAISITSAQIAAARASGASLLASMTIPSSLQQELDTHPSERLYTQSLTDFFLDTYYARTPALAQRLTLVYDEPREVHWLGHNTNAITAVYLGRFSQLRVMPYCQFLQQDKPLLISYPDTWSWIDQEMAATGISAKSLGPVMRGQLVRINAPSPCNATSAVNHAD